MADQPPNKKRRTEQSKEFRTIAVSAVGLSMNDNLAHVTLGLELQSGDPDEEFIQDEVRAVMTPRTLKVLAISFTNAVAAFEAAQGSEIQLAPGKEAELKARMVVRTKQP